MSRKLEGIVVHRTEEGLDGWAVNTAEAPNSYHYFINKIGDVDNMIPPDREAYHALKFNAMSVGIALYGDFAPAEGSRNSHPTRQQIDALVGLCVDLRARYGDLWIKGHSELGPDGTTHPEKLTPEHACPGENLDLDAVRAAVLASENAQFEVG